ncbi:MAG: rhodanese-like domain-containing protein [Hyphomicrobium sp.]
MAFQTLIRNFFNALWLLLAWPAIAAAQAEPAPPIVDVPWLQERVCSPRLVVLDLRRSRQNFEAEHIPCAVHSDYYQGGWRATMNGVENMIPSASRLEALIGSLGIANDSHVVLVTAALDMFSPAEVARVFVIFRYLGHDNVSIIDGGIGAWTAAWDNDIEVGPVVPEPATFTAKPRPDMIATRAEVEAAIKAGTPLIDMRGNDHYLGINRTRVVVRPGTIPGAVNLPMTWIVVNDELRFRTPDQLRTLWQTAGVPIDAPQILFCNSALESSIGWLAANMLLGNSQAKLYDGSLAEWSADPALPMELKVQLD